MLKVTILTSQAPARSYSNVFGQHTERHRRLNCHPSIYAPGR